MDEVLKCVREEDNEEDRYAVAVCNSWSFTTKNISMFIRKGGTITTGPHRYCRHLMQGGMEIPCQLIFVGMGKELKKIHCNLAKDFSKFAALKNNKR